MRRKGFTLIELVMVIVIIGLLAVVAIPKFMALKRKAIVSSEEGIISALQSAVNMRHFQNLMDPNKGDVWPGDVKDPIDPAQPNNVFLLLENPPPHVVRSGSLMDDKTWTVRWWSENHSIMILCPHYGMRQDKDGWYKAHGRDWLYNIDVDPSTYSDIEFKPIVKGSIKVRYSAEPKEDGGHWLF